MISREEITKLGLDMYKRGSVEALENLLMAIKVSAEGVEVLSKNDVIELVEYAIESQRRLLIPMSAG